MISQNEAPVKPRPREETRFQKISETNTDERNAAASVALSSRRPLKELQVPLFGGQIGLTLHGTASDSRASLHRSPKSRSRATVPRCRSRRSTRRIGFRQIQSRRRQACLRRGNRYEHVTDAASEDVPMPKADVENIAWASSSPADDAHDDRKDELDARGLHRLACCSGGTLSQGL
jgi:hypothetical protein